MKEEIKAMQADSWNYICTDVASWPYKDNITKIEIAFRATGSTAAWYGSRFQIDNVGYWKARSFMILKVQRTAGWAPRMLCQ